ncbi:hypothetical protein ABEV54_18325 [Peribacillus psychrosaccharolyticus]|uniref:hypothetical protein n=1 Tax=Peribacillus psychrosaccharolyticus TaxID=1407 RepID=UPI003D27C238
MAYKTIKVTPLNLVLDEMNPRFVTKNSNNLTQVKIMEYLINFEDVIQLAKEINDYNGLVAGERLLVIKENSQYKVLEGNRRTAAMHLLLNPTSIPPGISNARLKQIPKINSTCLNNISNIEIDVVDSRDDAIYSLSKRHIDGIKRWSQISKMFFYKNLFEQGKKLTELKEFTGESTGTITTQLKKYNFLRFILDNYGTYFPNSTIANLEIETELETDFIVTRIFGFITNELNISFTKTNYQIDLTNYNKKQLELLKEILVKISYLYWGENGTSSVIDSRKLNTQTQIRKFFIEPEQFNKNAVTISQLITLYHGSTEVLTNRPLPNDEEHDQGSDDQNHSDIPKDFNLDDENTNKEPSGEDSNLKEGDEESTEVDNDSGVEPIEDADNLKRDVEESTEVDNDSGVEPIEDADNLKRDVEERETEENEQSDALKGARYKPRIPSSYPKLTNAYKLNYNYKNNPRINKTKKELSEIEYKDFTISSMFLIRTLLESYVHEYIDTFASLPHDHKYKMTHITNKREKREGLKLQDLLHNNIKNHLKDKIKDYSETHQLIEVTFSKNNNTSALQIINFHVHSSTHYPDKNEILEAWHKISTVINTLDKLLGEMSGPK